MGNKKSKPPECECTDQDLDHHLTHNEIMPELSHPEINGEKDMVIDKLTNFEMEESSGFHLFEIHASSIGYTALAATMVIIFIAIAWCCCGKCLKNMVKCSINRKKKNKDKKKAEEMESRIKELETNLEKKIEMKTTDTTETKVTIHEESNQQTSRLDELGAHACIVSARKTCKKPLGKQKNKSAKKRKSNGNIARIARRAFRRGKDAGIQEQRELNISWGRATDEATFRPNSPVLKPTSQNEDLKREEDAITARYARILRSTPGDFYRGQLPPSSVYIEKRSPLMLKTPLMFDWEDEDLGYTFLEGFWYPDPLQDSPTAEQASKIMGKIPITLAIPINMQEYELGYGELIREEQERRKFNVESYKRSPQVQPDSDYAWSRSQLTAAKWIAMEAERCRASNTLLNLARRVISNEGIEDPAEPPHNFQENTTIIDYQEEEWEEEARNTYSHDGRSTFNDLQSLKSLSWCSDDSHTGGPLTFAVAAFMTNEEVEARKVTFDEKADHPSKTTERTPTPYPEVSKNASSTPFSIDWSRPKPRQKYEQLQKTESKPLQVRPGGLWRPRRQSDESTVSWTTQSSGHYSMPRAEGNEMAAAILRGAEELAQVNRSNEQHGAIPRR